MEELNIKREASANPEPINGAPGLPGAFDDMRIKTEEDAARAGVVPNILVQGHFPVSGHSSNRPTVTPKWANCEELNRLSQIELKELAVRNSLPCLADIERILLGHTTGKKKCRKTSQINW